MRTILLFLTLSLTSAQVLLAQKGELVKDINVAGSAHGLQIQESAATGNTIYMIADDSHRAPGLWKSDGTANGTVLVKEFPNVEFTGNLTASDGIAYFMVVRAGSTSLFDFVTYLYKSDGTAEGTVIIKNMGYEYEVETKMRYVNLNGSAYFIDSDGFTKTDGTTTGTVLLSQFLAGDQLNEGVSANGTDFFTIIQNGALPKLYKSDGTKAGTVEVENKQAVNTRPFASLTAVNSDVYFTASNNQETGLYKAGNTAGIMLVKTFSSGVQNLTHAGNSLYFTANDGINGNELWKTDGTAAGTVQIKNIHSGASSSDPAMLTAIDGQLYFIANDGMNGPELWKSDGTDSGTALVKDIRPGIAGSGIRELIAVGSKAAFLANDGTGEKLWQSNGNVYSTKVLSEHAASHLLNVNGTLYFNGNAGKGPELFKSTMVTGGTQAVTDIAKPASTPRGFTEVNGVSYFSADDGIHGRELWKTDGSTAGTMLVSDIAGGTTSSFPEQIINVNGTAFFVTGNGSQVHSLWKSDGTAAKTVKVKDFTKADTLQGLISVNGTLFFGVVNGSGSMQLWKSNGSEAGTQRIKVFPQTSTFSPVKMFGQVYFGAYDGINSVDLWKSNGTTSGTMLVKDLAVSWGSSKSEGLYNSITVAGRHVFYIITDVEGRFRRNRLVKSDGTAEGTKVIMNVNSSFSKLISVNNLVFFIAFHGGDDYDGEEVWRTDGTAMGTFPVTHFGFYDYDRISTIFTHNLLAVNDKFYCVPKIEEQLWKSDGTVEGTMRVTNIGSLQNGASIELTTGVGNTLYFTATDGIHGLELWKTQGTAESTSLAYDLNPNGSTLFHEIASLNNQLLISADNGLYGAELYKYQPAGTEHSVRINAGGDAFEASGSRQFSADQYYEGIDRTSSVATGDILNTADDELYRSGRCSPSFSYKIPVPNGQVNVILHFAEIWYGMPEKGAGGAGKRQFHVNIENSRKLTNFDIFAAAGGAMRAVQQSIPVTVTDGLLDIDFLSGAADMPRISAIEVVVTSRALAPVADAYVRDGSYNATNFGFAAELDIKNVANAVSLNRSAYLRFQLPQVPVQSAKLRIYGHNHENTKDVYVHAYGVDDDSWTENGIVKNNAPVASAASLGSVAVNDVYKYYEVDVTNYVKAQQQSGNDLLSLHLADPNNRNTRVIFNSRENGANPPQLVVQTPPVIKTYSRLNQEEMSPVAEAEPEQSSVYPNPAGKQFTVFLAAKHSEVISLGLVNRAGQSYQVVTTLKPTAGRKAEVDISALSLKSGIYLLKIHSEAATEVIKILVTE